MTDDDSTNPEAISDIGNEHQALVDPPESQSGLKTPLDACLACPHFKSICRSTVTGLFGLIGRRNHPPHAA